MHVKQLRQDYQGLLPWIGADGKKCWFKVLSIATTLMMEVDWFWLTTRVTESSYSIERLILVYKKKEYRVSNVGLYRRALEEVRG